MKNANDRTYLPALKGRIGKWAFYTTLMKFSEVNARIRFSHELYKNKNLSDMVQRTVNSDRAKKIAEYLQSEEERFFPAMVVAVFHGAPNWLEFSIRSKGAPNNFDSTLLDLAKLESFGLLELTGRENLFPIDGQHRLAGIRRALSDTDSERSHLSDDEITVTLIAHEPNATGRIRSRRLFTLLNKRAVPVKKHETIALDEDDVMAIATRYLVEQYTPFARGKVVSYRTNANIPLADETTFTTIVSLYDMMEEIYQPFSKRKTEELKFNRPTEPWLSAYLKTSEAYFNLMFKHFPEVGNCLRSQNPRKFILKHRHDGGGHFLFRPVGQKVLSQVISTYIQSVWKYEFENSNYEPVFVSQQARKCLSQAFKQFHDLPTLLSVRPYADLIWIPATGKMAISRASILRDIILKRYGLIKPLVDRKLGERLRRSIGPNFRVEDFLWK